MAVNHAELAFQDVRATVGADTHKTCTSRYDNSAYSSCVLQATALELTVFLCMKVETNCDSDDDDDETTAREEMVEAQTADNPQQNDVCEVCLVAPRDTRLAFVPCGHQRYSPSCMEQVKKQQLRCSLCRTENQMVLRLFSNYPTRWLTFYCPSVRLSFCNVHEL